MSDDKIVVEVQGYLADLVPNFIKNRETDVGQLIVALTDSDYAVIRHIAHDMKGVGAGYGFQYITDLGEEISSAAKQEDAHKVKQLIEQYKNYLSCLEVKFI